MEDGSYSQILTPDISAKAFPFHAMEYGHFVSGSQYFTRRDGRNEALMMYTTDGCGEIEWKGQKCLLEPGNAVVIYCDTYHAYRTVSEDPWVFNWIHFDGTGLEGFRPLLLDHLSPVFFGDLSPVSEHFHSIENTGSSVGVLSWAEISHSISGMLLALLRGLNHSEETDRKYGRSEVRALVNYIQENHTKQLTAEDFMQVTNLSKYHLIHMFRQQMGIPPYKYKYSAHRGLQTT